MQRGRGPLVSAFGPVFGPAAAVSDRNDENRTVGRHAVDDLVRVPAHDHEPVGAIWCCAPFRPVEDSPERRRDRFREAVGCSKASFCIPISSCRVFSLGGLGNERLAIESGLSPDTGLHILPRGGLHATRVKLRRPPLNFSEPFGAEGGPVLGVLVIPHGVNKPEPFSRTERPRGVDDLLKRGHGHVLSVTGFPTAGTKYTPVHMSVEPVSRVSGASLRRAFWTSSELRASCTSSITTKPGTPTSVWLHDYCPQSVRDWEKKHAYIAASSLSRGIPRQRPATHQSDDGELPRNPR